MINLYLLNRVDINEELEGFNSSIYTRDLANKLTSKLCQIGGLSVAYHENIYYLTVSDDDLLDDDIEMYLKVSLTNELYIKDEFNNDNFISLISSIVDTEDISVLDSDVTELDFENSTFTDYVKFCDNSEEFDRLFPTDQQKYYSVVIKGYVDSLYFRSLLGSVEVNSNFIDIENLPDEKKQIILGSIQNKIINNKNKI